MQRIGLIRHSIRQFFWLNRPGVAVFLSVFTVIAGADAIAAGEVADGTAAEPRVVEQLIDSPLLPRPDYAAASDRELTKIGARWDDLSLAERSALLKEVKLRMAQRKDRDGVLTIRTQRRYGRVYGGGQYLKIETKVVRITSQRPEQASPGSGFGVGFEHRSAQVAGHADDGDQSVAAGTDNGELDSPVVRVSDVSQ